MLVPDGLANTVRQLMRRYKTDVYTPDEIREIITEDVKGAGRSPNGLIPAYENTRVAGQAINNLTFTAISWDTIKSDTNQYWNSSNPTRHTFRDPGRYILWASIAWAANTAGSRYMEYRANGTTVLNKSIQTDPPLLGVGFGLNIQHTLILEVSMLASADIKPGDYLELRLLHDSGAVNLAITAYTGAVKIGNVS